MTLVNIMGAFFQIFPHLFIFKNHLVNGLEVQGTILILGVIEIKDKHFQDVHYLLRQPMTVWYAKCCVRAGNAEALWSLLSDPVHSYTYFNAATQGTNPCHVLGPLW